MIGAVKLSGLSQQKAPLGVQPYWGNHTDGSGSFCPRVGAIQW